MAALLFVQAIGERGRGGFVDETEDFEAGEAAGVFRGLSLRIVEIGRNGDHGTIDWFIEIKFRPTFEFAKDESGDFGRREEFVAEAHANYVAARLVDAEWEAGEFVLNIGDAAAHQALDGVYGALGLAEETLAGWFTYKNSAIGIDADYRGAQRRTIGTLDTHRLARLRIQICNQAVCGAEIDSYCASHFRFTESWPTCPSSLRVKRWPLLQFFLHAGYQITNVAAAI